MIEWRVLVGDVRERLRELPAGSAQTCVTSPPYWGLRDYGTAQWAGGDPSCLHRVAATGSTQNKGNNNREGSPFIGVCGLCGASRVDNQIGLEPSPDAYVQALVAVFREVKRVLRDDGTVWLNLGDSYASGEIGRHDGYNPTRAGGTGTNKPFGARQRQRLDSGLKPKDLCGIPWRVAFALQQPYYAGTIRRLEDRVWLAAMLEAEGCLFIHKRKTGQSNGQGYVRKNDNYGPGVEICNTSPAVIERIHALVGRGSICTSDKGRHGRKQTLYRWNLRTTESRDFVREIYPHLIAKRQQARIMCGCPSSGERAEAAHAALIGLHNGIDTSVDFPEPASMFEPGWFLRSDVIWSKSNPMPESVTDRPTKSHEYLFLLSKRASYYYDVEAIAESASTFGRQNSFRDDATGAKNGSIDTRWHRAPSDRYDDQSRNKRSVWHVATQPYPEAHFATYPEKLIEPCILAGSRLGDTVLDPFCGSGTTGAVAVKQGRSFVGVELNPAYVELARQRIGNAGPLFAQERTA